MTPLERLSRITTSLGRASELTLQRIETELGLTPRPESPDAGAPWSDIGNPITEIPSEESGDQCAYLKWPSCPLVDCNCSEARDMLRDAPMTPVSERGMHE